MEIKFKNKRIRNFQNPYIIAEMACAHDGDYDKALRIIDAAIDAKADAIQLQFFITESTVTPNHPVYDTLKKIQFDFDQWKQMVNYCREKSDIDVWVCTYDWPTVDWAIELKADGIKINSADLSNPELLEAVAKSGIPFTIGTGASQLSEVRDCIDLVEKAGATHFVLMHGVQNFPTEIKDLKIHRMELLKASFPDYLVGYADHTNADYQEALWMDALAVAKGAAVLEKHITWDRSEKGIDHQAALNPNEFSLYVNNVRKAYQALGKRSLQPLSESELKYRKFQKKSVVAKEKLSKGEKLTREKVVFLRNDVPGISPADFNQIEGKILLNNIEINQNILPTNVE